MIKSRKKKFSDTLSLEKNQVLYFKKIKTKTYNLMKGYGEPKERTI